MGKVQSHRTMPAFPRFFMVLCSCSLLPSFVRLDCTSGPVLKFQGEEEYQFVPLTDMAGRQQLVFKVKAEGDVLLGLGNEATILQGASRQVALGFTETEIRECHTNSWTCKEYASTDYTQSMLWPTEFGSFWVMWSETEVFVGRGTQPPEMMFLEAHYLDPLDINVLVVAGRGLPFEIVFDAPLPDSFCSDVVTDLPSSPTPTTTTENSTPQSPTFKGASSSVDTFPGTSSPSATDAAPELLSSSSAHTNLEKNSGGIFSQSALSMSEYKFVGNSTVTNSTVAPKYTASNNTASKNTASNNTASNNTASNNIASSNTASNVTAHNVTASNNTASNNTGSNYSPYGTVKDPKGYKVTEVQSGNSVGVLDSTNTDKSGDSAIIDDTADSNNNNHDTLNDTTSAAVTDSNGSGFKSDFDNGDEGTLVQTSTSTQKHSEITDHLSPKHTTNNESTKEKATSSQVHESSEVLFDNSITTTDPKGVGTDPKNITTEESSSINSHSQKLPYQEQSTHSEITTVDKSSVDIVHDTDKFTTSKPNPTTTGTETTSSSPAVKNSTKSTSSYSSGTQRPSPPRTSTSNPITCLSLTKQQRACRCMFVRKNVTTTSATPDLALDLMETKTVSASVRRRTSAIDDRQSSRVIGLTGVILSLVPIVLIVLSDLLNGVTHFIYLRSGGTGPRT